MKRRYKASVFFAVIGLTLMYAASLYIGVEETDIGEIDREWNGRNVKISGEVTSFSRSSGHAFFDVNDSTGEILVADFDSGLSLEKGDAVNVTGHVSVYEGKLEVIAKDVEN